MTSQNATQQDSNQLSPDDIEEKDFSDVIYLFQQVDRSRSSQRPALHNFSPKYRNIVTGMILIFALAFVMLYEFTSVFGSSDKKSGKPQFCSWLGQHSPDAHATATCETMSNIVPQNFDMYAFILALLAFQSALAIAIVCENGNERNGGGTRGKTLIRLSNLSLYTSAFTASFLGITVTAAIKDWGILGPIGFLAALLSSGTLAHVSNVKTFDVARNEEWLNRLCGERRKYIKKYNIHLGDKSGRHTAYAQIDIETLNKDNFRNCESRTCRCLNSIFFAIRLWIFMLVLSVIPVCLYINHIKYIDGLVIDYILFLSIYLLIAIIITCATYDRDMEYFLVDKKMTPFPSIIGYIVMHVFIFVFMCVFMVVYRQVWEYIAAWMSLLFHLVITYFFLFTEHETRFSQFFKKRRRYFCLNDLITMTQEIHYLKMEIDGKDDQRIAKFAQANEISSWVVHDAKGSIQTTENMSLMKVSIDNGSDQPIYDVVLTSGTYQGAGSDYLSGADSTSCIGTVPPGKFTAYVPYPGEGMHVRVESAIAFRDNKGNNWIRDAKGILSEIKTSPYEYLKLDLPPENWRSLKSE